MKDYTILLMMVAFILGSCDQKEKAVAPSVEIERSYQNEGHRLIAQMTDKVGSYQDLLDLKDVVYTYHYKTPDGKMDRSTEKYIFDGELSKGIYHLHERTLADLEGEMIQGYDGKAFWVKSEDGFLEDEAMIKQTVFNRKTNFYWFAMMQKLMDPGLIYEHLGPANVEDQNYDIVKVSFETKEGEEKDIYQMYINKDTQLADQFLFTVADYGITETPLLMKVEYETVDGILIPSKRQYKFSTWDAAVSEDPWIEVNWTDIKFGNDLSHSEFEKI
jgi:hypothetical protein